MTKRLPLNDVADVHTGISIDPKRRAEKGVKVFGLAQVAGRASKLPPCIPEDELDTEPTRLRVGDIVLALIGQAGRTAVIGAEHDGAVLDRKCVAIRRRDAGGPVTQEWLQVWARSSDFRSQTDAHTTGMAIPRVSIRAVRGLQVPVPTRGEQLRAYDGIERLDAAVSATRRTLAVLEELLTIEAELMVLGPTQDDQR